ncbi:MAG: hypothetical protein AAF804_11790, partial [Bacteroidota bacterium]
HNMEAFINDHVHGYALEADNLFRLSAYTELRATNRQGGEVRLDFEGLGSVSFYQHNFLLRTPDRRIFHFNHGQAPQANVQEIVNDALDQMFEHIPLFSNGSASPAHIAFVDEQLSRKTLDPFHKVFLRYLFLHFGRFDSAKSYVEFHSSWLPQDGKLARQGDRKNLGLQLSGKYLRGYYLNSGARVYLDDAKRDISYATGELANPNVAAFKLFLQELMSQSASYLLWQQRMKPQVKLKVVARTVGPGPSGKSLSKEPLYHEYNWIPMMLGMLRANEVSFGDPEIVCYFVDKPYFNRIYQQLTVEEQQEVDQYRPKPKLTYPVQPIMQACP